MKKEKKKKVSSSGMSARDKMLARKKKLTEKGGGGFIYLKEGSIRVRIKSPGEDEELGIEVIYFYDPKEKRSIYSPATFDEYCPWLEKYQELKASSDEDDKELAKQLVPKRKYVIGGYCLDDKGKTVDKDTVDKLILIPGGVYQDIIDLYLDEDEWGDMTDRKNGYDIKINRTGSGKNNTNYSVTACKNTPMVKEYAGTIDLEKLLRANIPSEDELQEKLNSFLNGAGSSDDDDDDDERPRKKKKDRDKKSSKDKKGKKKRRRDDDDPGDDLPF